MKFITKKFILIITLVILASSITSITIFNKLMSSSEAVSIPTNDTIDKQSSTTQSEDINSAQKSGLSDEAYRLNTLLENGQSTITAEEYYSLVKKVEELHKYNTDVLGEFDGDCPAYNDKLMAQRKLNSIIIDETISIKEEIYEYELKEANPEIKAYLTKLRDYGGEVSMKSVSVTTDGTTITVEKCLDWFLLWGASQ